MFCHRCLSLTASSCQSVHLCFCSDVSLSLYCLFDCRVLVSCDVFVRCFVVNGCVPGVVGVVVVVVVFCAPMDCMLSSLGFVGSVVFLCLCCVCVVCARVMVCVVAFCLFLVAFEFHLLCVCRRNFVQVLCLWLCWFVAVCCLCVLGRVRVF